MTREEAITELEDLVDASYHEYHSDDIYTTLRDLIDELKGTDGSAVAT